MICPAIIFCFPWMCHLSPQLRSSAGRTPQPDCGRLKKKRRLSAASQSPWCHRADVSDAWFFCLRSQTGQRRWRDTNYPENSVQLEDTYRFLGKWTILSCSSDTTLLVLQQCLYLYLYPHFPEGRLFVIKIVDIRPEGVSWASWTQMGSWPMLSAAAAVVAKPAAQSEQRKSELFIQSSSWHKIRVPIRLKSCGMVAPLIVLRCGCLFGFCSNISKMTPELENRWVCKEDFCQQSTTCKNIPHKITK